MNSKGYLTNGKKGGRPHTEKELNKLDICRNYLKEHGVYDADSFNELVI